MGNAYAVTDSTSLQKVLSLRRNSRVVLSLPALANEESSRLQDQLNRLVSECGCGMSACGLVLAVGTCGFYDAAHWSTVQAHIFQTLGINVFACFAAAAAGRAGGRFRAKWKLARTVKVIEARLT